MAVDDVLEGAVMVAAMAALALELAIFWSLPRLAYAPPTPIAEPPVIYDTPSANVVYVDGVTYENAYRLRAGDPWLEPCTPAGVMRMLHKIGAVKPGLKAVVVGRSEIVGKPMADMLQLADMTVTTCNSKTPHATLADECRRADVIVTAVGKPSLITPDMLGYDQVVIDVGITRGDDGKLHGDVDPECGPGCAFLSPVPGGVGLLTRAMLAHNVVEAARWCECR